MGNAITGGDDELCRSQVSACMNTGAPIQTHLVPLPDPDVELLTLPLPTVTPLVKLKVRLLLWLIDGKGWL